MPQIALFFLAPALLIMAIVDQLMISKLNCHVPGANHARFPYFNTQKWISMRTGFNDHFPDSKLHLVQKCVVWAMIIGICFRYLAIFGNKY